MAKYRFVWRKHRNGVSGDGVSRWKEKHIQAKTPSLAVAAINKHIQKSLQPEDSAELDHLFFEIKEGGLQGHDRLDFTLLAEFARSDRPFVQCQALCCAIAHG